MGMIASYRRITPEELEKLRSDSAAADRYFGLDIDENDDERGMAYYFALVNSERYLNIDKAWHSIHFILTGIANLDVISPPLSNVVAGGAPTEWEAGIGVVCVLTPQEVREVSEALRSISRQDLLPRLDPVTFNANKIYPAGNGWVSEGMEGLLDVYDEVADFFHVAASAGDCILLSID